MSVRNRTAIRRSLSYRSAQDKWSSLMMAVKRLMTMSCILLQSLKHHMQSVHSSVRIRCTVDECPKEFSNEKSMRCHQKRRHFKGMTDEEFRDWVERTSDASPQQVSDLPKKATKKIRYSQKSPDSSDSEGHDPDYKPGQRKPLMTNRSATNRPKPVFNRNSSVGQKNVAKNDSRNDSRNDSFVYKCNFDKCYYKTFVFEKISDHFVQHWENEWNIIRNS